MVANRKTVISAEYWLFLGMCHTLKIDCGMTEFCQREIMKSWIVLLCELFSIWPTAQETGEGDTIVISHRTKPGIYFRMIPVSLANLEYQSRMDMRLSALPAKKRMPAMRVTTGNHKRGGCKWNGAFRVGRYCRHGGKAIPASWIVISSQTKQNWVRYDMFANVHGWIVRPRFRTVCGTMRQNSVRHALKSRVAHGYCIGCAECWRWHVRAGVRYVGMGWCWQHAHDEICDATMIAVSSGGTYRTGTCRRHARLHRFTSKLRLISKKCGAVIAVLFFLFSFFTRVTQLAKNHSWSAKRNAGNGDLRMVRSCCGNLYENESILSYLYVHIGSNGVIETWVRWVLPFGLSKKCKH